MIAPVCPACDHIGHPTIVASSRFLPGPHKYRPADADGPLFATRKEAEEWACATRCEHGDTTPTTAVPELRDIAASSRNNDAEEAT